MALTVVRNTGWARIRKAAVLAATLGKGAVALPVMVATLTAVALAAPPAALAQSPPLPAFEVPLSALTVADYWTVGEVAAEGSGRIVVRVMRLRIGTEPPEFSVELKLPAADPDGFQAVAIIPEAELAGTIQAINTMLTPGRRPEADGRDEMVVAYSPVPDLVISLSLRANGPQLVAVYIQGEAATLRGDRGLVQLRDVLVRAQGRIRDLRQRP